MRFLESNDTLETFFGPQAGANASPSDDSNWQPQASARDCSPNGIVKEKAQRTSMSRKLVSDP